MKRTGILHGQLAGELAALGNQDLFMICNAKIAIPRDVSVVDLALEAGIPTILQVLEAILRESCVEYYFITEELKEEQQEIYSKIHSTLHIAKEETAPNIGFKSYVRNIKFAVRTGDMTPYGNIILRAGEI